MSREVHVRFCEGLWVKFPRSTHPWLPSGVKGFYYYLYLILDLYSGKIVGWEIWPEESAENASILVKKAVLSEGCLHRTQPLILHSDNGSPMKGAALLETLYKLGVATSRSRPRVSNDNAYAESIFRTVKYRPNYPYKGFSDLDKAREWVLNFTRFYNYEHRHTRKEGMKGFNWKILEGKPIKDGK